MPVKTKSLKFASVDVEFTIRRGPLDISPEKITVPVTFKGLCQIAEAFGFKPKVVEVSDTFAPQDFDAVKCRKHRARYEIGNQIAMAVGLDEVFEAVPQRPDLRQVSYRTLVFFRETDQTAEEVKEDDHASDQRETAAGLPAGSGH